MAEGRSPVYLARASYRRRRLIDAQRLLPFLLLCLWLLPLLWGGEGTDQPLGAGSRSFVHVFVVWALGILAAGWLAFFLAHGAARTEELLTSQSRSEGALGDLSASEGWGEDHTAKDRAEDQTENQTEDRAGDRR